MVLFIGASPRGGLGANALCLSCDKPPKEQSAAIILVSKLPDMIALDYQCWVAHRVGGGIVGTGVPTVRVR